MRAVQITRYGGPEVLVVDDVPAPVPGPGQVLVRVEAAAVQVADVALREGHLAAVMPDPQLPTTPGWEFAGVVDALGPDVGSGGPARGLLPGARVVGMTRHFNTNVGAHAELVAVPAGNLAVADGRLSPGELAALPIALIAVQALDLLGLESGESILITGGVGAVGGYATQLARARGARVIASVAPADEPEARSLGAHDVVDRYRCLAAQVHDLTGVGADAALNLANIPEAMNATRTGGRLVATLLPAPTPERDIDVHVVFVQPDGAQLAQLLTAAEHGDLRIRLAASYPLTRASDAYRRISTGHLRGRVIVHP